MFTLVKRVLLVAVVIIVSMVVISPTATAAVNVGITSPTNGSNQSTSFSVIGTATPNRSITLTVNGNPAGNTTSDGLGNWSINLVNQSIGNLTIEATVTESGRVVIPVSSYEVAIHDLDGNQLVPNIGLEGRAYTVAIANSKAYVGVDYHCTSYDEFSNCDGDENYGVAVIDLETNTLQGYVHIPSGGITDVPAQLIFNGQNNRLYLLGQGNTGGEMFVIDTSTDSIVTSQSVPLDNIGRYPWLAKMSDDGSRIIVSNGDDRTISTFNTVLNTFGSEFVVCTSSVTDIAILGDNSKAYIGCGQDDGVVVFDLSLNSIIATIPTGDRATRLAKLPNSSRVFVNNDFGNTISVIDPTTDTVVQTIATQNQNTEILVNNAGTRLYSLSYLGLGTNETRIEPYSINAGTLASLGVVNIGTFWSYVTNGSGTPNSAYAPQPNNLDISQDDSQLFVPGNNATSLAIFNTANNTFNNFNTGFESRAKGNFVRSGAASASINVITSSGNGGGSNSGGDSGSGSTLAPTGSNKLLLLMSAIILITLSFVISIHKRIHITRSNQVRR